MRPAAEPVWLDASDAAGVARFLRERGWIEPSEGWGDCTPPNIGRELRGRFICITEPTPIESGKQPRFHPGWLGPCNTKAGARLLTPSWRAAM
jgi:hypothetical protein